MQEFLPQWLLWSEHLFCQCCSWWAMWSGLHITLTFWTHMKLPTCKICPVHTYMFPTKRTPESPRLPALVYLLIQEAVCRKCLSFWKEVFFFLVCPLYFIVAMSNIFAFSVLILFEIERQLGLFPLLATPALSSQWLLKWCCCRVGVVFKQILCTVVHVSAINFCKSRLSQAPISWCHFCKWSGLPVLLGVINPSLSNTAWAASPHSQSHCFSLVLQARCPIQRQPPTCRPATYLQDWWGRRELKQLHTHIFSRLKPLVLMTVAASLGKCLILHCASFQLLSLFLFFRVKKTVWKLG